MKNPLDAARPRIVKNFILTALKAISIARQYRFNQGLTIQTRLLLVNEPARNFRAVFLKLRVSAVPQTPRRNLFEPPHRPDMPRLLSPRIPAVGRSNASAGITPVQCRFYDLLQDMATLI
ncbi:hypothetical protein [Nitratireductor basaltis]|uniref:hypothetical protein n=1 Tax=Nitratireductor basaltis TaxID=472175 RepID=UPI0012679B06|nr:hypothetical protein [Nitratireductor basaltis]